VARPAKPARKGPARAARSAAAKPAARAAGFELSELRDLIDLVQGSGIGELELTSGDRAVRISAAGVASVVAAPAAPRAAAAAAEAPAKPLAPAPAAADNHLKAITSPMVGTFYRAPAPDADPFVEKGDDVEVGQTVCIVEAMKLMNEIEAEFKGRVVQVLVENAQPVEFGQKLFLVEPA
jgi:acetyl-CoA carboxylase biotin carboxyl carrier protein